MSIQEKSSETTTISTVSDEVTTNSQDSYSCTECSSYIEIISIDATENNITFKCENHGIKTMPIDKYIPLMENNTYLFSKCSICSLRQNEKKDTPIFSFCTKCRQIICTNQNCINKHFENNKVNHQNCCKDNFIDNNKRGIQCIFHQKKNEVFCFDCKRHLCKECLRGGEHIKHSKATPFEYEVPDENKEKFNDMLRKYKDEKVRLEKVKEKEENKLNVEKQKKIETLDKNLSKSLEENENKLKDELKKLKLKYLDDVELMKNKYKNIEKKCNDDYNNDKKEINKKFDERSEKLECKKKIKDIDNLILINEIIRNAQEKYQNNYYNNINFNKISLSYDENQNNNINDLFAQNKNDINANEINELNNNDIFSSDPNNINFSFNLVENSYADCFDQNSFLVYNTKNNNELILVYSTNQKSIIFFDITSNKNIHEIKNAHKDNITSLRFDSSNEQNNLLLSIAESDIKLWDINNNYKCILQLNNIYNKENNLASACLLHIRNNKNVIITCGENVLGNSTENIKIYDLEGHKINEVENSGDESYFIDTCFDNVYSKFYIITGNLEYVKTFDYNSKKEYHKYCDTDSDKDLYHISVITYVNKGKLELIDSCKDGKIRIWDFHKNNLINKIVFDGIIPTSLCIWNDQYLFFGTEEKGIKLIDISKNNLCNTLNDFGHDLSSIVKIKHSLYGECLLSQNEGECPIKIWIHKK